MRVFSLVIAFITWAHLSAQQVSTVGEIYDFEVGDEFHYEYYNFVSLISETLAYDKVIITGKSYSNNQNTVHYSRSVTRQQQLPVKKTVSYSDNITFNNLSDTLTGIDSASSDPSLYNGRTVNYRHDSINAGDSTYQYIEGCGHSWKINRALIGTEHYTLRYYKKGQEEWGSPIFIGIREENNSRISLSPNPSSDFIRIDPIHHSNGKVFFSIHNASGQVMKEWFAANLTVQQIDIRDFPSGMYTLTIVSEKKAPQSLNFSKR